MLRFKQDCQDWQSTDAVSVTKKSRLDPGVLSLVDGLLGCVCSLAGSLGGIGGGGGCWKGKKLCGAKKQPDPQVRLGLSKYAQQAQTIFKLEQYKNLNFSSQKLFLIKRNKSNLKPK